MNDIELNDDEIPLLTYYPVFQRLILSQLMNTEYHYTKTQFVIFSALTSNGAMNMSQIAHAISASNEQATRAVAPLVEDGYVERFTDPGNRTRVYVRLTEAGKEYTGAWRRSFHKNLDHVLRDKLSGEEYSRLRDAINTSAEILRKVSADL